MSETKICPKCDAEYFSHIKSCAHCNEELIAPEMKAALKTHISDPGGQLVCIFEDGSFERIKDLSSRLTLEGVAATTLKIPDEQCAHGDQYGIYVHEEHVPAAIDRFAVLIRKLYPELTHAEQMMNSGHCPACGANLKEVWSDVCPDCGLVLITSGENGSSNCGGGCSTC